MRTVAVVGGGAAGMMAAYSAAVQGARVTLFEKNEKLGKKMYITGKGRCNFTNTAVGADFFGQVVSNPKFLYSAIYGFDSDAVRAFFAEYGLKNKVERGGRVFPQSDKSSDVIRTLTKALKDVGVEIRLREEAEGLIVREKRVCGVKINGSVCECDAAVVATGGFSYRATGSKGSGYQWAKACGHAIVPLRPSLSALSADHNVTEGLSLKNVRVSVCDPFGTVLASEFGEMLFTAGGVSGPVILTLSSRINRRNIRDLTLSIDLKPALNAEQLDERILRDFQTYHNRDYANSLHDLLPKSLIPVLIERSGIAPDKKVNQIKAEERMRLAHAVKNLDFALTGIGDIDRAIVTAGGVDVRQVNPSSMESKLVGGLYFAGEVLDVDALTGGFNLQIAFSTGRLAGLKSAEEK